MFGHRKTHPWIADPLDGTTNFLHAIPHFAVTVGSSGGCRGGTRSSRA